MNYWLVKQEPEAYAWKDLIKDKKTSWVGVRNYQARNNLQAMRKGDLVLFYHSISEKQIVGIATVVKEAYPDPSTKESAWVTVDLAPTQSLKKPVTLEQIKNSEILSEMALVRQSRLSVMPVSPEEYACILKLAGQG